ncbi:hypothetical protein [Micromonospora aurantiaca (nom. illeg.)]|uniref:hypothetical protein n=1 Tax=Micromonospora aurantiaca (nom. illeg.) TaxID=47850 RepID=UPI001CA3DA60|nr:hypothetical protein [Micromonospora aurantiaca]
MSSSTPSPAATSFAAGPAGRWNVRYAWSPAASSWPGWPPAYAPPKARWLAAGIGAGLTFSALSDTCTMGRILSALPYNRGPRDHTPAEIIDRLPAITA